MTTRRQLNSHARAAALWGLALFALGQLAVTVVEAYRVPEGRDPEYTYRAGVLRQTIADHPDRPLVLVIGSSRVALGFQPDVSENYRLPGGVTPLVFNFSIPGSGSLRELMWLKRLLNEGVEPEGVIVECWPPLMTPEFGDRESVFVSASSLSCEDLWLFRGYAYQPLAMFRD